MMAQRSRLKFYTVCWLLAPAILFLMLPIIGPLAFYGNSDALFYGNILTLNADALWRGDPFPRWLADADAGFGSPVMMFYAPLAYIISALINLPFTLLHPAQGVQLLIGMYASQIACGYTAFLWLRRSFAPTAAFAASLLFVLLPYKLIYIYLHVNLSQLWALAFLPLWMIAAERLAENTYKARATGFYALAAACVYYTHPLTFIAFAPVPLAYVVWVGRRSLKTVYPTLTAAHMLAALLCFAQALPGHAYLPWIHAERFFEGPYAWYRNFSHIDVLLCAYYGIIALLVGVAVCQAPALRNTPQKSAALFWCLVLALVFFLTQRISYPVWQGVTLLQYLQFPAARLHAPSVMAATYLICLWLANFKQMMRLSRPIYHPATLALLILFSAGLTVHRVYTVESDPGNASDLYLEKGMQAKLISTPVPLYETRWGCIDAAKAFRLFTDGTVPSAIAITSGKGVISDVAWHPPGRIAFKADIESQAAQLAIRQCYWPIWRASDNSAASLPVFPETSNGTLGLTLSRGEHDIVLTLFSSPLEAWSRLASALGLAILVILLNTKENPAEKA